MKSRLCRHESLSLIVEDVGTKQVVLVPKLVKNEEKIKGEDLGD